MRKAIAVTIALAMSVLLASNTRAQDKAPTHNKLDAWTKAYIVSQAAKTSGWAFDFSTSRGLKDKGYKEGNKLFQDAQGYFSPGKFLLVNGGTDAILILLAWKFPGLRKYLAAINFGWCAPSYVSGFHNRGLR